MDECITKEMTKSLLKAFEGMNESLEDFQKACASTIESTEKHIVSALFLRESAMRVSPVAWAYDNLDKVLMEAEKTAIVTHNHPEGVKGAVAVAHAIYYLRTTHNQKVYENIMQSYYPQFMVNDYYAGIFDETCQGTVPLCLKIIRVSTSFEDAIRRAISWGGDSDTIGAIVGSMAEALWGIPDSFIWNALRILPDDMRNVIGCFYNTKIEVI